MRNAAHLGRSTSCRLALLTVCFLGTTICFQALRGESVPQPSAAGTVKSPLSPADSLKHLQVAPGLRVELVAAEPDVIDPVSIAFDELGRMWVVEMTDYPHGPKEKGEAPRSRIRLLEDRDGDGHYDHSGVFADKLLFVTGLTPWKGGVIVTLAGEVAYFKDTDGDGKADHRETWFRGFAQENSQLRANHPTMGLDNWIYIANGLRGGTVVGDAKAWGKETEPVSISGMDFRFNPHTGEYQAVSGIGQFGLTFDDFGNRFVCSNRNPCRQIVLQDYYLKRNPYLGVREVAADVSPAAEKSRVYALSRAWTTSTQHAGQFTAACGVTIYRGDALPAAFRGNSFTCEPTGNLVHRDILSPAGATFTSRPGREGVEFLASPDEWFRPVNMANGPDGALYVIDMYRAVIEHPQFVPEELKNRADQEYGNDRGRIYRILPAGAESRGIAPSRLPFKDATIERLVELLAHPNAWHRETAARLIYERRPADARQPLERLARESKDPVARVHALWALEGLGALSTEILVAALKDSHPRVREQAVLLSEAKLAKQESLLPNILPLADDDDGRLRFQVALTLGSVPSSPEVIAALGRIALRGAADDWTRRAVLTSVPETPHQLLESIFAANDFPSAARDRTVLQLVKEIAELIGARQQPEEVGAALGALFTAESALSAAPEAGTQVVLAGLNGLGQGLARRGRSLSAIVEKLPATQDDVRNKLEQVYARALEVAENTERPAPARVEALGVLQFAGFETAGEPLLRMAHADPSQDVQIRAIEVLATFSEPRIGEELVADFPMQTPAVRRATIQAVLRNVERTRLLLEAISQKEIAVAELDATAVRTLTSHKDVQIRKQANELLASALPADRQQVLAEYQKALTLSADPLRGRAVFEKNCTTCHKIGDLGVNVGPDIADSRTKTPAGLLTDILQPNKAIDNNYMSYTLITQDGKILTGIIAAETASSVTLRQPEDKTVIVLRQDIDEMRSSGVSLMPDGLEKNITIEQMADLISFIKNWRYLDGQVPAGIAAPIQSEGR